MRTMAHCVDHFLYKYTGQQLVSDTPLIYCLPLAVFAPRFRTFTATKTNPSIKMTEYDYSQEAMDRYMQTQSRIQDWTAATARSRPVDPSTPPTPASLQTIGLPPTHSSVKAKYQTQPSRHQTQDIMRKVQASAAANARPAQGVATGNPNQVYSYRQQTTTPYSSQLDVTTQTMDGRYIQQQSYRQTTAQLAPQSLAVPPVNYAPLAQNPFPSEEHFNSLSRASPNHRIRSKSGQSDHRSIVQHGNGIYAPPVPPIPERHRAQSSARPPGAAAPFHPSHSAGAYANGTGMMHAYAAPTSAVSSLHLPTAYLPASNEQLQYQNAGMVKSKSKSSATLKARYATEARRPRVEDMPPMPAPHHPQTGFYAAPRASKSSATLYAEPRGTPTKSKGRSSKSSSKHSRRPPMSEFGEKMSSPHPAASQMLVHSLIPVATYREESAPIYEKKPTLFARVFLGAKRRS
ncbi:hypothetical protein C8F04DRAFT_1401485 [Mycena alexandri]|uniref:Uncharacterized protein n=1 Tax=Mycena alexandri TaxID=1745969 RepID=A0AAD6SBE3_9AGAR|nr:hypothetical protein C8F04DRAFT_1401485 [Mycena alexandri]